MSTKTISKKTMSSISKTNSSISKTKRTSIRSNRSSNNLGGWRVMDQVRSRERLADRGVSTNNSGITLGNDVSTKTISKKTMSSISKTKRTSISSNRSSNNLGSWWVMDKVRSREGLADRGVSSNNSRVRG